ncbi:MAG TPA: winged helix-turn-helix transcriptional regulator, partial [Candidatus Thermoplasmatota archaeon]|nr:winged helix-turn-helix transcriptional regulator [Candidatus Thermoplasmatota archaeon]
ATHTMVQPGEEAVHRVEALHARLPPGGEEANVTVEVFDAADPALAFEVRFQLPPPSTDVPPALMDAFAVHVAPPDAPLRVPHGGGARGDLLVENLGERPVRVRFPRALLLDLPPDVRLVASGRPASVDLAPGERATVRLLVEDDGSTRPFEGALLYPYDVEGPDGREPMLLEVRVRAVPATPLDVAAQNPGAVALAVTGGAVLLALPLLRREDVRYAALAALYARLRRPQVLGHADRERILALVRARPGIRYAALQRETGLATGALLHHLRALEAHGLLLSRREGSRRVFFEPGAAPDAAAGLTPTQARLLEMDRAGGLSQREMGERLGITQQAVSQHLREMERRGLR